MPKDKENKEDKKIKLKKISLRKNGKGETTEERATGKKSNKRKKIGWKIFKICLFTFVALAIVGAGIVLAVLNDIIKGTDTVDMAELELLKLTSTVYDKDGKLISTVATDENRVITDYKNIPTNVINAVVAIEDERYFSHHGIDVKRTVAAVLTYVVNKGDSSFGGSTITQQLVKNVTDDKSKSWQRKIREWYRAIALENTLSKEQILESYLNKIYYGEGAYGIEIAAQTYFGKSIKDVNLAEAACLAAAIQSPEGTNPYKGDTNKEKLLKRQKVVLDKMLSLENMITKEEYDEALKYKLVFKKGKAATTGQIQTYFVDAVIEQVVQDLMVAKNISEQTAKDMVITSGYKIYSTMDSSIQKSIDNAFNDDRYFYTDKAGDFMQAGLVTLDHKTGYVLGISGGAGKKSGSYTFNRATSAYRQPGSTFKAIAAYGPAFEQGLSYPGMGIDDSYIRFGSKVPGNYYGYYNGYVTARRAIALSMNIPAIRTWMKLDPNYSIEFAKNMGISKICEQDNSYPISIGGLTHGASVLEMAAAYGTFANGGVYVKPTFYTKVVDNEGKEVLINKTEYKRVMKETTAYLITNCLVSVVTSGTGTNTAISGIQSGGKTGNTNGDKDQWYIGMTPYYTTAVWNGYDIAKYIGYRNYVGYGYTSQRIYTTVMREIHKGKANASFNRPAGIVSAQICTVSGLVATDACKADSRKVVQTEIFASGTVPTATCDIHKTAEICTISKKIATDYCHLYKDTVEKSFITRETVPAIKPKDWDYMLPTDVCTIHTSAPVEEPEPLVPATGEEVVLPTTPDSESPSGQGGGIIYNIRENLANIFN